MSDDYEDDGGFADYDPNEDAVEEVDEMSQPETEEGPEDGKDDAATDEGRCELSGDESEDEEPAEPADGAEPVDDDEGTLSEVVDEVSRLKLTAQTKPKVDPIVKGATAHRKIIIVPDEERQTTNILQKAEAARIDAIRAKQMESFPTIFVDAAGIHDSVMRARKEREEGRSPLLLRRQVGYTEDGSMVCEEWCVRTMVQPALI